MRFVQHPDIGTVGTGMSHDGSGNMIEQVVQIQLSHQLGQYIVQSRQVSILQLNGRAVFSQVLMQANEIADVA